MANGDGFVSANIPNVAKGGESPRIICDGFVSAYIPNVAKGGESPRIICDGFISANIPNVAKPTFVEMVRGE